jgi:predicted ferric reductase
VPALVLAAILLGGLIPVALWWDGELGVLGLDGWLTNAGRIAGLLAGYAAPVLIVLMSRIPFLERNVGSDRLARWHAAGGRWMTCLVLVHVLTIVWGYSLTAHQNVVAEGWDVVFHYPDMIKATLGTLLLFAVGIVSARAARKRVSYEVWYHLHLGTYVAIALTFAHAISNGAELGDGKGRAFWYLLYFGCAALVAWFRLLRPWLLDRRHRLTLAEVRAEGPGVVSLFLTGRRLDELGAEPGQFFRLQFQAPGLRWVSHPYSLSAPPTAHYLRFTVKDLGDHSAAVAALRPGTKVRAEGPYGAFTARRRRAREVLLVAAGVGITPLRALFETIPAGAGELTLLYRASDAGDLVFRQELEQIAAQRGARLHYLVGRRSEVGDPLTAESLSRLVPGLSRHDVYLCGPERMAEQTVRALRAAGVPRHRIHHESFAF